VNKLHKKIEKNPEKALKMAANFEQLQRLSYIGAFAATVAHELRNPLATIRTAAYNLNRKNKDSNLDKHIRNIDKKVIEADRIINNMLFYSGLKKTVQEPVKIIAILEESLKRTSQRYSDRNIEIEKNYSCPEDACIKADSIQMKELFSNIISNAYDSIYSNNGKIILNAYCNKRNFILQVTDNGIGMAEEELEKFRELFYTSKARGTGLGLAVCKEVVDLHNGSMEIDSAPEQGTTVTVKIPKENG